MSEKPDIEPLAYPPETILDLEQAAEWLQVSPHTLKDWNLMRLKVPGNKVRFSAGMLLAQLEGRLDAYLKRAV